MPISSANRPLLGRRRELDRVDDLLEATAAGETRVMLLGGDAGMGKTRLLTEIHDRASRRGFVVLAGGCLELGEVSLPFAPVADAVRGLRRRRGDQAVAAALGPDGSDLLRLLPGSDVGRGTVFQPNPGQVFEAVLSLLDGLGRDEPVLLTIEDAQWADQSTRDLLTFLVRAVVGSPVMVVVTYRSDDLTRRHPLRLLLAETERLPHVVRCELDPLDYDEIATLLYSLDLPGIDPGVLASVWERSEGNPFHAEELMLAEACCDRVPTSVRDAMLARVNRLDDEHRALLRLAAAVGRKVDDTLLSQLSGLARDDFNRIVRDLVADAVVTLDGDGYRFRHALLQEVVYDELLPGERVGLHRRIAEHLAPDPEAGLDPVVAGEVAHHWSRAQRLPEALTASVEAGLAAEAVGAAADALVHYERALEIWDSVPDAMDRSRLSWLEIVEHAQPAAFLAGRFDRSLDLVRAAVSVADADIEPLRAAIAHCRLGRELFTNNLPGATEHLDQAVALVAEAGDAPERAHVLAAYAQTLMLLGRFDDALPAAREGLEVALAVGDRRTEGHLRNTLGVLILNQGDVDQGLAQLEASMAIAKENQEVRHLQDIGRAYVNLAVSLSDLGRWEEAIALVDEGLAVMPGYGLDRTEGVCLQSNGVVAMVALGRWDEAVASEHDLQARMPGGHWGYFGLTPLFADRGDFDSARAAIERVGTERFGDTSIRQSLAELVTAQISLAIWEGRPMVARDLLEDLFDQITPAFAAWHADQIFWRGVWAQAEAAELHRLTGDDEGVDAARAFAVRLIELADEVLAPSGDTPCIRPSIGFAGYLRLAECELARLDRADSVDRWLAAAEGFDELRIVHPAAYARFRAAEVRVREGDRAGATGLLREVLPVFEELGARPLLASVAQLAARARLDVGAAPVTEGGEPDDGLGLSSREREVLGLVAAGRTNRQIGEALYISPKTASVHVSNILAKLGVSSRVEAAGVAHRVGLAAGSQSTAS